MRVSIGRPTNTRASWMPYKYATLSRFMPLGFDSHPMVRIVRVRGYFWLAAISFVFGSVAKGKDTAKSDIDLMVISDTVAYADLFAALEPATNRLQRSVNPTLYSRSEIDKRMRNDNAFVKRVLAGEPVIAAGMFPSAVDAAGQ